MTSQYSPEIGFQTSVIWQSIIFWPPEDLRCLRRGYGAHDGRPRDGDDAPCDPHEPDDEPNEPPSDGGDMTPGGGHGSGDPP